MPRGQHRGSTAVDESMMTGSTRQLAPALKNFSANVRERVEFGDTLLFLYFLVFVRQYLWIFDNNSLAWALSVPLAAAGWFLYVRTKSFPAPRFGLSFWLVVGLPLLAFYLLRAAFPDHSFDVLSYHLLHAERSLRGTLFAPGDFFPTSSPFNPAPDTLLGISRVLLGFRLGTVLNLLALVWAAQVADKILRIFIAHSWLRSACVLLTVVAENFFFEISTYMVELLALPLLLEATFLILRLEDTENRRATLIHIALLLGASTAFKFTNLAVVLPLVVVCVYKTIRSGWFTRKQITTTALLALIAFVAPLLPFAVYIYRLTGNPVFPIANVFFKSPYWPTHGGWDARWGPQTWWETIGWPVMIWFKPERHSELAVYSGRLSLGVVAAIVGLVLCWRNKSARTLCLVLLASALLWSAAGMGYSRYGFYQELLAGVAVFAVAGAAARTSSSRFSWRTIVASFFCLILALQSVIACRYVRQKEWGGRTTFIANGNSYLREAKFMFRDRTLTNFLAEGERASLAGVRVWMETCPQSTGFQSLLKPDVPIIAARQPEYFFTRESRRQFVRMVEELPEEKMFSLCLKEYLGSASQAITTRGLGIGRVTPFEIAFFSPHNRIGLMLIEVLPQQGTEARQKFQSSWMNAAFPDSDYREEITAINAPTVMRPGEKVSIRFKVKNLGYSTWTAIGNKEGRYQVNIGDRWLNADATIEINGLDGRTAMPADLLPGKEVELPLAITAPQNPGDYIVEVDMVHEGVTWFYERGAQPLRLRVRVQN